jgi:hypothetical protein
VSRLSRLSALLVVAALASGCSITAPRYSANYAGITELKAANLAPVSVSEVAKASGPKKKTESVTIRGSSYDSPYGSFESHLNSALREDLSQAGLLTDKSDVQISSTLIRNELNGAGVSLICRGAICEPIPGCDLKKSDLAESQVWAAIASTSCRRIGLKRSAASIIRK